MAAAGQIRLAVVSRQDMAGAEAMPIMVSLATQMVRRHGGVVASDGWDAIVCSIGGNRGSTAPGWREVPSDG